MSRPWSEICARLDALATEISGAPYPPDPASAAAHLAEQVVCWLGWAVQYGDPRRPAFHRQNDLVTPWGGPNADNVYRHARIDPSRSYRIHGRMHGCDEFVLALRAGFMHQPVWGTLHNVSATDLGIGRGDEFELFLGGPPRQRAWVPVPDGAVMASFREYYYDWSATEPAVMTIECLDADAGVPRPRTPAEVDTQLLDAVTAVEHSVRNWNTYLDEHRAAGRDNVIAPPMRVTKGLPEARYAFCFWDLGPDDALVLETTVPEARYWSAQLYRMGWFDLIDPLERVCSLNHSQATPDRDGRVRIVVSHRDPGVVNWLDAGGHRTGLLTLRWFWSDGDPTYATTVVPLDSVRSDAVTPDERVALMASRRRHLAWRFRT